MLMQAPLPLSRWARRCTEGACIGWLATRQTLEAAQRNSMQSARRTSCCNLLYKSGGDNGVETQHNGVACCLHRSTVYGSTDQHTTIWLESTPNGRRQTVTVSQLCVVCEPLLVRFSDLHPATPRC